MIRLLTFLLMIGTAEAQILNTISTGTPANSFTAVALSAPLNGTAFAVSQGRGSIVTWQTSFTVAPTAISVVLQGSLDNVSYFTIDTNAVNTGGLRYLGPTSIKFVRCRIDSLTIGSGSGLTCSINVLGFNSNVITGGTLTTNLSMAANKQILLADGTAALPSLAFVNDSNTGFYNGSSDCIYTSAGGVFNGTICSNNWTVGGINGSIYLGTLQDVSLIRDAANTLALRNGTNTQEFRIGPSGGYLMLYKANSGGAVIRTSDGQDLSLGTNGTSRWEIDGATGNLIALGTQTITAGSNIDSGGRFLAPSSSYFGWNGLALIRAPTIDGAISFRNNAETQSVDIHFGAEPVCSTNCGTSPTVVGTNSSFTLTMGTTPASGFLLTFAGGGFPVAPQCNGSMALTGMVIGKLPLTFATTLTTLTIVTNGTAPATGDKYHFWCSAGQ